MIYFVLLEVLFQLYGHFGGCIFGTASQRVNDSNTFLFNALNQQKVLVHVS